MKNFIPVMMLISVCLLVGFVVLMGSFGGCAKATQTLSHFKSNMIGLDRVITLYSNSGEVIKTWNTRSNIEDQGGSFRFMVDNKAVQISGTVIIEEK